MTDQIDRETNHAKKDQTPDDWKRVRGGIDSSVSHVTKLIGSAREPAGTEIDDRHNDERHQQEPW